MFESILNDSSIQDDGGVEGNIFGKIAKIGVDVRGMVGENGGDVREGHPKGRLERAARHLHPFASSKAVDSWKPEKFS